MVGVSLGVGVAVGVCVAFGREAAVWVEAASWVSTTTVLKTPAGWVGNGKENRGEQASNIPPARSKQTLWTNSLTIVQNKLLT